MDFKSALCFLLIWCQTIDAFDFGETEKSHLDWLDQTQLANSVPRIGRRSSIKNQQSRMKFIDSLSPFHSFNGGISRFFDLASPNVHPVRAHMFDTSFSDGNSELDERMSMRKRENLQEDPKDQALDDVALSVLTDSIFWAKFLNEARQNVYNKLYSKLSDESNEHSLQLPSDSSQNFATTMLKQKDK